MKVAAVVIGGIILYKLILAHTGRAAFFSTKFAWTPLSATGIRQKDTAIQAYGG